jgi:hypothetical protein
MGNSPDDGWIHRTIIEVQGPVADPENWEAYKQAILDLLEEYDTTIGAEIVEISRIKKPASSGSDTEPDVDTPS